MIDTVVLSIPQGRYKVSPRKFRPYFQPVDQLSVNERDRFMAEYKGHKRYIQNPLAYLRDKGLVYPNLTIDEYYKRNIYKCDLKISFSCPKIIWGHSFEEILDSHFSQVVDTLMRRLFLMEVSVTKEAIKHATVHTLHYCANILFPSQEDARLFLSRLSKTSLNAWFENNDKNFANDGRAVRFHTDTFEIVFYLKYYDVLEKGNRSVGRKTTLQEKEKAKMLLEEDKIPPLVRMEVRLNGTRSVKTHLETTLEIKKDYWTFQEVFNSIYSRKVQQYYWNKIIDDQLNKTYLSTALDEDICQRVLRNHPKEKLKNISEALGLFYLVKSLGVKGTKEVVTLKQNRKAWYDKRKKIIDFTKENVTADDTLIAIITSVLTNKPVQLGLPI
jgi:hypothetical protein